MVRKASLFVVVTAIMLVASSSHATDAPTGSIKGRFSGWSSIDATGQLQTFTPDGAAQPAIARALEEQLRTIRFVPARNATGPAATRTYLVGDYVLEPAGADLALRLGAVSTGPKITKRVMPRPPRRIIDFRSGAWGRVAMTVGADGKPAELTIEDAQGPGELARQLRDAAKQWRFEPETVDGSAYPTRLRQDFTFSVQDAAVPPVSKCPEDASAHARAPGQSSCLPIFEVTIEMNSKRLGREIRVDNPR